MNSSTPARRATATTSSASAISVQDGKARPDGTQQMRRRIRVLPPDQAQVSRLVTQPPTTVFRSRPARPWYERGTGTHVSYAIFFDSEIPGPHILLPAPRPLVDLLHHLGDDPVLHELLIAWARTPNPNGYSARMAHQADILQQVIRLGQRGGLDARHLARLTIGLAEGMRGGGGSPVDVRDDLTREILQTGVESSPPRDRERVGELIVGSLRSGFDTALRPFETEIDASAPARIHAGFESAGVKQDAVSAWFKEQIAFLKPADVVVARQSLVELLESRAAAGRGFAGAGASLGELMSDEAIDLRGALHMFYAAYAEALKPLMRFTREWAERAPTAPGRDLNCRLLRTRVMRHAGIVRGEQAWLRHGQADPSSGPLGKDLAQVILERLARELADLETRLLVDRRRPALAGR